MKGMVFTEFLEMVETTWSLDMVDGVIARAGVGGAYTAVGTYPHAELVALVTALAEITGQPPPVLLQVFGRHLFGRFVQAYGRFFEGVPDSLTFLAGIEDIIHAEVRKLYPDAELPSFAVERQPGRLVMTYYSRHPQPDLALGLIEGCLAHFNDGAAVHLEDLPPGSGAQARFVVEAGEAP
ncbi:MAG: heme NO-binding domain-containing protein [Pseudomonadota bacterium]